VNGLPAVVIELEEPGVARRGRRSNRNPDDYSHAQNGIPQLFWFFTRFLIASNGSESRPGRSRGGLGAVFRVESHRARDEPRRCPLGGECLRGTGAPARLLDPSPEKLHFVLGSTKQRVGKGAGAEPTSISGWNTPSPATLEARKGRPGRGGVFWQTQDGPRASRWCFYRAEDSAQGAGQLDLRPW